MAKREFEDARIFNPETGQYEKPRSDQDWLIDEHKAQAAGEPAPGDRTLEELRQLEPGQAGPQAVPTPVVTTGVNAGSAASSGTGGTGATAARAGATGGGGGGANVGRTS